MSSEMKKKLKIALLTEDLTVLRTREKTLKDQLVELRGIIKGIKACTDELTNHQLRMKRKLDQMKMVKVSTKDSDYLCIIKNETKEDMTLFYKDKDSQPVEVTLKRKDVTAVSSLIIDENAPSESELMIRIKSSDEIHFHYSKMVMNNTNIVFRTEGKIEEVSAQIQSLENRIKAEEKKQETEVPDEPLKTERNKEVKKTRKPRTRKLPIKEVKTDGRTKRD